MKKSNSLVYLYFLFIALFSAKSLSSTTYYHNDISGTPLAATSQNGALIWTEVYSPFGEKQNVSSKSLDNDIGFHGKPYDNEFKTSYMLARSYDPIVGRFLAPDPIGFNTDNILSFNRYIYANNNPLRYIDPDGKSPLDIGFFAHDLVVLGDKIAHREATTDAFINLSISGLGLLSPIPGAGLSLKALKSIRAANISSLPQRASSVTKGAGKNVKEGIYEFTDTAGKKYCGQSCNIPNRFNQHVKSGKLDPNQSVTTTEVLGGKTAREIAEHKRIQEITGGVPARRSSAVSNKVDPIGPNRRHLLDD